MEIKIERAKTLKPKPAANTELGFGRYYTDHMFVLDWDKDQGWHDARIVPFAPIPLDPATMVLHYAQETFEGLKAYRTKDGRILLFRPEMNARRFANSNRRLCMPELSEEMFVEAIEALVSVEQDWVPAEEGTYAASIAAQVKAEQLGYTQVLWLDGVERRYVEEVGTMNVMFMINDEIITAPCEGTVLPGVTRDSIIQILRSWGYQVSERHLAIDELMQAGHDGTLQEAFGTGTAAVISPIGELRYRDDEVIIHDFQTGELTQKLYDTLTGIQWGDIEDTFGWTREVK